jgi:hypothetical protein
MSAGFDVFLKRFKATHLIIAAFGQHTDLREQSQTAAKPWSI